MKRHCGKLGSSISRYSCCAVYVVSMACLWGMVAAQAAAPPMSPPANCEGCSRDLVSTVWGFILTFVALTVDDWGIMKSSARAFFAKVAWVVVSGPLNPLANLSFKLAYVRASWIMRRRLKTDPEARSYIRTDSETSYIRTLVSCKVVVKLSATAFSDDFKGNIENFKVDMVKLREDATSILPIELLNSLGRRVGFNLGDEMSNMCRKSMEEDYSDAIVLGNEVLDRKDTSLILNVLGKEMLIKTHVLPPIERLKILQGSEGLGMAFCAAQGVRYIYGVLVRVFQRRHVSPIEVVGFFLSIMMLVRAICHYFVSSCHRPLVIFLNDEEQKEFIKKCEEWQCAEDARKSYSSFLIEGLIEGLFSLLFCGILVLFFIYNLRSTSYTLVAPLIILIIISSPLIVVMQFYLKKMNSFTYILGFFLSYCIV